MMNRRFLTIILGAGVLATFGACSTFEPETYDCTHLVSVSELGARVTLAAETGDLSVVRLNGIDAVCEDDGEKTNVQLGIGLKVSRPAEESENALLLEVPFIAAKLDSVDTVIGHESFSYRMAFGSKVDLIYPLMRHELSIPAEGRVVISLVSERIELN
jgi:hypothetical protein